MEDSFLSVRESWVSVPPVCGFSADSFDVRYFQVIARKLSKRFGVLTFLTFSHRFQHRLRLRWTDFGCENMIECLAPCNLIVSLIDKRFFGYSVSVSVHNGKYVRGVNECVIIACAYICSKFFMHCGVVHVVDYDVQSVLQLLLVEVYCAVGSYRRLLLSGCERLVLTVLPILVRTMSCLDDQVVSIVRVYFAMRLTSNGLCVDACFEYICGGGFGVCRICMDKESFYERHPQSLPTGFDPVALIACE